MTSSEKIWEIIQNKGNISGTWRHWRSFYTSFSDEPIFLTIHENFWDYTVRIIVFDKPQRWGKGNLQVLKVCEPWTLNGAKEKVGELERKLKSINTDYKLPILSFLADNKVWDIENLIEDGIYYHTISLKYDDGDSYLRPFDILQVSRGLFYHVAIYLGKNYVCHFSGNKAGSSDSSSLRIKKDTLRNFFEGKSECSITIARPITPFKANWKIKQDIAGAISSSNGYRSYGSWTNNCEHFANLIVLGLRYSDQTRFEPFTSWPSEIKKEVRVGDEWCSNNLIYHQGGLDEINDLIQETDKDAYGNWEARIEVNPRSLDPNYCKIQ